MSSTHANPLGVKTDAPPEVVWDVMRVWAKQHPGKKTPAPGSAWAEIMSKEPKINVNFTRASAALSASRMNKEARFPANPQANWGPKRKHTRQAVSHRLPDHVISRHAPLRVSDPEGGECNLFQVDEEAPASKKAKAEEGANKAAEGTNTV